MPKTKFQSIIFTALMVFCMVYCMTVCNIALKFGALSNLVFLLALKEMWLEYVVVFCLIFFVITSTAKKLAIQCFIVCQIVPVITLFATLVHNGISAEWFAQWIQLAVTCFPMALCIQVFFVGPFVRMVFRNIFQNQL